MRKVRVLFVCMDNAARSQMAEALLRASDDRSCEAFSAGIVPAASLDPLAVAVMKERGLEMNAQRPKTWQEFRDKRIDCLVTLCRRAERHCPALPGLGTRLSWPFEDPARFTGSVEERMAAYRVVRDGIERFIVGWLQTTAMAEHRVPLTGETNGLEASDPSGEKEEALAGRQNAFGRRR
jgi:arsenate reductase